MKKLTIKITDIEAIEFAYPTLIETKTVKVVNREKLYPLVKALHDIGISVEGVDAFYTGEQEVKPTEEFKIYD